MKELEQRIGGVSAGQLDPKNPDLLATIKETYVDRKIAGEDENKRRLFLERRREGAIERYNPNTHNRVGLVTRPLAASTLDTNPLDTQPRARENTDEDTDIPP